MENEIAKERIRKIFGFILWVIFRILKFPATLIIYFERKLAFFLFSSQEEKDHDFNLKLAKFLYEHERYSIPKAEEELGLERYESQKLGKTLEQKGIIEQSGKGSNPALGRKVVELDFDWILARIEAEDKPIENFLHKFIE